MRTLVLSILALFAVAACDLGPTGPTNPDDLPLTFGQARDLHGGTRTHVTNEADRVVDSLPEPPPEPAVVTDCDRSDFERTVELIADARVGRWSSNGPFQDRIRVTGANTATVHGISQDSRVGVEFYADDILCR